MSRLTQETGRLAELIIAVLDHFVEQKTLIPKSVRSMLTAAEGALRMNEDDLSHEIFTLFRTVLEDEELVTVPRIAKALEEPKVDVPA